MTMLIEPVLGLGYGWASTDVYNTQMDQNWLLLGSAIQLAVLSIESDPPTTPASGDRYIVGPTATGAWVGKEGQIATYLNSTDGWFFLVCGTGWRADVSNPTPITARFNGATWDEIHPSGESNTASNTLAEPGAWFKGKVSTDLVFKVAQPGDDMDIESTPDAIILHAYGVSYMESPLDDPDTPVNVEILGDINPATDNRIIRSLREGALITLAMVDDVITITCTGVDEAPEDGLIYGRQDGAWVEAAGAGGGADKAEIINSILTDGENILLGPDGSVLFSD